MGKDLLAILKEEIKPALGCTGPISIAYVTSVARKAAGGNPKAVRVIMDKDSYKGNVAVGIPGTPLKGLDIAAALGALAGNPDVGLEVLKGVTPEDEKRAEDFLGNVVIEVNAKLKGIGLSVDAFVKTDEGEGHAKIFKTHDNVVLIEANGEVKFKKEIDDEATDSIDYSKDEIRQYGAKDFFDFAKREPLENLLFLRETVKLNEALYKAGLDRKLGAGIGSTLMEVLPSSFISRAKARAAAAADARMAGLDIPAMSCATSGNAGLTASVPLISIREDLEKSEEELLRSLALSFLLTISVKSHIGRLSSICSCTIGSSIGVAAGTVLLMGGSLSQAERAINSLIGAIGGIVCDGAKAGCALKLADSVGAGIESALLSMKGTGIPKRNGLVCDSADESITAIGKLALEGMVPATDVMFNIIMERDNVASIVNE